eukprot:84802-Pelagomonas_calceolata.AAC.6
MEKRALLAVTCNLSKLQVAHLFALPGSSNGHDVPMHDSFCRALAGLWSRFLRDSMHAAGVVGKENEMEKEA